MASGGWKIIFIISMAIGIVSFFSGEYGIWFVFLILLIISLVKIAGDNNNLESTSKSTIESSLISESDLENNFSRISWRKMEELTGELFRKKGYSIEVTQASGDYGIDVWAKKDDMTIGIQVKKWRKDVGFDDVAKTLGSNMSKANKYILISTTSFFTPQAWEHQKQHSTIIELWDTNRFKKEIRSNFVKSSSSKKPIPFTRDEKDSFDNVEGFNIDEVYDSPEDSYPEFGIKCTKCGSAVFRDICGNCGKEIDNLTQTQNEGDSFVSTNEMRESNLFNNFDPAKQKHTSIQHSENTSGMASFTGELQDFYDIVLPKIRNSIASMTKKKKIELGYICQHCDQKNELDSAHKQGRSLRDIVKNVLEHYKSENGVYVVSDLNQLILKIKGEHVPIENSFLFLCKKCHRKYDGKTTNNKEELHITSSKDKPMKEIKQVKNTEHLGIIPQKGEEFTEKELYEQYAVRNSGGIRPSTKNKVIILINSFFSENQGGYENETHEKSGFVYHVGEGEGNQEMKRNNKSIFETQYNGYTMLYFDKPEQNRLFYRFKVEYDSHEIEKQTNSDGILRDVIIFKLKIVN